MKIRADLKQMSYKPNRTIFLYPFCRIRTYDSVENMLHAPAVTIVALTICMGHGSIPK